MPNHHLLYPLRVATAAFILLSGACADQSVTPTGPLETPETALARGGPNQLPTSAGRIYFSGFMTGNYDLFSVKPDGSDLRRLTYGAEFETSPAVSPDGKKIAYLKQRTSGLETDLWIMNADGTRPRLRLAVPDTVYNFYGPVWSPDGRTITLTYVQSTAPFERKLASVDANTGAVATVGAAGMSPSWSPDGRYLAFTQRVDTTEQLFTSRPDGTDLLQRTDFALCCGLPRWSPDGNRILVVVKTGPGSRSLFAANAGGGTTQLPTSVEPAGPVAWSPDAAKIVFADIPGDLWVSLANGGGATRILAGAQAAAGLSWAR
ncbi:MAG TPA: hypothetical protein VJQ46_17410 [Gemmatimonadales bacterium]|nr:hypothetical protein [Gemmatimonadales bacterium]